MSENDWESFGEYFLQRQPGSLGVRSPSYDEDLLALARAKRARWSPGPKVWIFSSEQEPAVLERLAEINAIRASEKVSGTPEEDERILSQMRENPLLFEDKRFRAAFDPSSERFSVRFPYNPNLFYQFRKVAGAQWDRDGKTWTVPIAGQSIIFSIIDEMRAEQSQYLQRNQAFAALEETTPLSAKPSGPFGFGIAFDPKALSYKISSKIPLDSGLGREILSPIFEASGLYDPATENPEKPLPRIDRQSVLVEAAKRDSVEKARIAVSAAALSLGAAETIFLSPHAADYPPRRPAVFGSNSRLDIPLGGEIVLSGQKAYLISYATRAGAKAGGNAEWKAIAFPISHAQVLERVSLAHSPSEAYSRISWLSGIDYKALPSYLEAVKMREDVDASLAASAELPRKSRRSI